MASRLCLDVTRPERRSFQASDGLALARNTWHIPCLREADALFARPPLSVSARHCSGANVPVELSVAPFEVADGRARTALLSFRDACCQEQSEPARAGSEAAQVQLESQLGELQELLEQTAREIAAPLARAQRSAALNGAPCVGP